MITIRRCVVLLSVLCASVTGALAQDNIPSVFVTNKEDEAIAKHRLTVENVRQLFAVERELLEVMKDVPDLNTRVVELGARIDPYHLEGSVAVDAKVCEGIPEIARILQTQRISAREYVLTKSVAMAAAMGDEALKDEAYRRELEKAGFLEPMMKGQALQFWRSMDPALKAAAEEWKKVREEMEKHSRDQ